MSQSRLTDSEKAKLFEQSNLAVHNHVYGFSLALMDDREAELGSGTLVEVAGKWFVATAAHCIPASPTGRLRLHSNQRQHTKGNILGFLKHGRHPTCDVGYLELDPSHARSYLTGKRPCPIARLYPAGIGAVGSVVSLVGCPKSETSWTQQSSHDPVLRIRNNAFATVPMTQAEWPTDEDQQVHVLLPYPVEGIQAGTGQAVINPAPQGFSGGGVWDHGHPHPGVWQPELARLIAIQSSWNEGSRYLRAVQIVHWLSLLFSDYPTLQSNLRSDFPNISFPVTP